LDPPVDRAVEVLDRLPAAVGVGDVAGDPEGAHDRGRGRPRSASRRETNVGPSALTTPLESSVATSSRRSGCSDMYAEQRSATAGGK
jgi:hypothetical protein